MDREILEMLSVISFVISVVVLIVFLVMASNIAKIKTTLIKGKEHNKLIKDAEKAMFAGNIDEGVNLYHAAAYEVLHSDVGLTSDSRNENLKLIAERITKNGGRISSGFADVLQKRNIQ